LEDKDLLKNGHSGSLKNSPLTPPQGILKKGDVNDDADDDDEVRTSTSEKEVTGIDGHSDNYM
jgi:hypothetical protein